MVQEDIKINRVNMEIIRKRKTDKTIGKDSLKWSEKENKFKIENVKEKKIKRWLHLIWKQIQFFFSLFKIRNRRKAKTLSFNYDFLGEGLGCSSAAYQSSLKSKQF